jgi:hypothetical protein
MRSIGLLQEVAEVAEEITPISLSYLCCLL